MTHRPVRAPAVAGPTMRALFTLAARPVPARLSARSCGFPEEGVGFYRMGGPLSPCDLATWNGTKL